MARSPVDESMAETEIPPTVWCAQCGQAHCEGCASPVSSSRQDQAARGEDAGFLWESDESSGLGSWLRFSQSALQTIQPERFAWNGVSPALRMLEFAILAEALAILSFALPVLGVLATLFPHLAWAVAHSAELTAMALGLILLAVFAVLALHVLWGLALEVGVSLCGIKIDVARGQRFGLYACGWDVLSSPAGFILVSRYFGATVARGALSAGFQAPRSALNAYLRARGVEPEKQNRAVAISFLITGGVFLAAVAGLAAYWLAQALG